VAAAIRHATGRYDGRQMAEKASVAAVTVQTPSSPRTQRVLNNSAAGTSTNTSIRNSRFQNQR
jgi:hypothetical protein